MLLTFIGGMKLSELSTIRKSTTQDAIEGMPNKMGKAFILFNVHWKLTIMLDFLDFYWYRVLVLLYCLTIGRFIHSVIQEASVFIIGNVHNSE